ncbi:TrkH family potassium uptake protein [Neolewinella lacunae]|uniref:TrkH family potassium uptake protein n=1 Tax=Neolewinella lacunae TaxID=1517758 RepID=A0A923T8V4_9BACT|nr:TrkH family potassium uptake protein [Neolewinella lacunae]MBC6994959.1 TrkH family potassium uptake protein [Neolewinella lacunae]MDN3633270.1 TrkH family potassium uptake protein [Neolewinella lacunae]
MINYRPIARVISILLVIVGGLMWTGVPFSAYFDEDLRPLLLAGLATIGLGALLYLVPFRRGIPIRKREGYLIVVLSWLAMIFAGMLPYLFSGIIPNVADALFETVSGMTTTGASVLTDIEIQPRGLLYWRSLTQWIGGMGIIVLTVAIFPLLGIGGIELFAAEAPGPTSDKLHPRISETAKRLWLIYVGLTVVLVGVLTLLGMSPYEAINHALTTMATGGFSTRNASAAAFSPAIQYALIAFMFLAGVNYTVLYLSLKRRWADVWKSEELKAYFSLVVFLTVIITIKVYHATGSQDLEQAFRDSLFQIVSLLTTTGFVSADYTSWTTSITLMCFVLLFLGACAGSTSGGIKVIRHLVFFKNSYLEFKRLIHPAAIVPLRLNQNIVPGRIITHVFNFLLLYLLIFVFGSVFLAMLGLDFMTSIGAMATCLGNVGPGIGEVGPVDNFAWLPGHIKVFLSFVMLIGRLEIFTVLVLFTPFFWRLN